MVSTLYLHYSSGGSIPSFPIYLLNSIIKFNIHKKLEFLI